MATPDLSCICNIRHSSQQHQILNPRSKGLNQGLNPHPQGHYVGLLTHGATTGTPVFKSLLFICFTFLSIKSFIDNNHMVHQKIKNKNRPLELVGEFSGIDGRGDTGPRSSYMGTVWPLLFLSTIGSQTSAANPFGDSQGQVLLQVQA